MYVIFTGELQTNYLLRREKNKGKKAKRERKEILLSLSLLSLDLLYQLNLKQ
jgi:hypothetical protein